MQDRTDKTKFRMKLSFVVFHREMPIQQVVVHSMVTELMVLYKQSAPVIVLARQVLVVVPCLTGQQTTKNDGASYSFVSWIYCATIVHGAVIPSNSFLPQRTAHRVVAFCYPLNVPKNNPQKFFSSFFSAVVQTTVLLARYFSSVTMKFWIEKKIIMSRNFKKFRFKL